MTHDGQHGGRTEHAGHVLPWHRSQQVHPSRSLPMLRQRAMRGFAPALEAAVTAACLSRVIPASQGVPVGASPS